MTDCKKNDDDIRMRRKFSLIITSVTSHPFTFYLLFGQNYIHISLYPWKDDAIFLSLDKKQPPITNNNHSFGYNSVVSSADHCTEFFIHVTDFFFYSNSLYLLFASAITFYFSDNCNYVLPISFRYLSVLNLSL